MAKKDINIFRYITKRNYKAMFVKAKHLKSHNAGKLFQAAVFAVTSSDINI